MKKIYCVILCLILFLAMPLSVNAEMIKTDEYRIFTGENSTLAIDSTGEILFKGYEQQKIKKQILEMGNVIDISEKGSVVAINSDGKLLAKNIDSEEIYNEYGKLLAVENGTYGAFCLREGSSVVAISLVSFCENTVMPWENIIDLVQIQCSFYPGVCALSSDGSVYSALGMYYEKQLSIEDCGQVKPELFKNIVEIDAAHDLLVGLKSDGTVVATNFIFDDFYSFEDDPISAWSGIVDIAVNGEKTIYGLKEDGTVITNSENETILESIENWKGIIALYSGANHVVALRRDGKLLTVGKNEYGQCDIGDWNLNPMSGDANDDGIIDAADALKILKVAAKVDVPEERFIPGEWSVRNAKVTDNGKKNVTAEDAFRVLEYAAGINKLLLEK